MRFLVLIMCLSTANIVFAQEDYSDESDFHFNFSGSGWFPVIDETNSDINCTDEEFVCEDGSGCIRPSIYCDGWKHCRDGSDEILRILPLNSSETGIPCRQGDNVCLLPKNEQAKKNVLCTKDPVCTDEEFACEDGSRCIPFRMFCDGYKRCRDGSDEIPRILPLNPTETGIPCRQRGYICLLPKSQQSKRNGLCTKDIFCTDVEFACEDGSGCLASAYFCDGFENCKDGSDEKHMLQRGLLTEDITCEVTTTVETRTCALPKKNQCDGSAFCKSGVDECLCVDGDSAVFLDQDCFRCLSHPYKVIPIAKLCNGVFDCPDLSDECICKNSISRPALCNLGFESTEGLSESAGRSFLCDSGKNTIRIEEQQICDGQPDCRDMADESSCSVSDRLSGRQAQDFWCDAWNGQRMIRINAARCDGKPECWNAKSEECNCYEIPRFCQLLNRNGLFRCKDGGLLYGTNVCDGLDHCGKKEDELLCTHRTHFYCHDDPTSYVLVQGVCDQKVDCADESDEQNCDENFRCFEKGTNGFGTLYVHTDKICDGTLDCTGGADECQIGCRFSVIYSSLIENKGFLGALYIISSVALCGNIAVFFVTMRVTLCPRRGKTLRMLPKDRREKIIINRVLILSLAISDALVAIYTMAICIKSSRTEGEYCLQDQDWRSGRVCSALGALFLIGSEESVFTMIIITVFRLYTIWRPYGAVSVRKFSIVLALTWIISTLLGVIPLLPHLEDTFTTSIWYKDSKLFTTIEKRDVRHFTYWFQLMHDSLDKSHSDIGSWSTLEELIGELKPNFTPSRRFGFYSSHAVCIPDFFPNPANTVSWWYSLLLIIINFLGFLVIAIGYFLIYRRATKKNQARDSKMENKVSSTMQKRLTAIITTDFLCWIPVCIMSFLQLSGMEIPYDVRLFVGMIIIPINSAFNPIIYSGLLSVLLKMCKRFRNIICHRCIETVTRHIRARRAGDTELNRANEGEVQQPSQRVIEETMAPDEIHATDSARRAAGIALNRRNEGEVQQRTQRVIEETMAPDKMHASVSDRRAGDIDLSRRTEDEAQQRTQRVIEETVVPDEIDASDSARRAGDIELNRREEDEAQQRTQRVIEETMTSDEIHASDSARRAEDIALNRRNADEVQQRTPRSIGETVAPDEFHASDSARRAGDIELSRRNEDEVQQQTQRVIEETMSHDEVHASDSARRAGDIELSRRNEDKVQQRTQHVVVVEKTVAPDEIHVSESATEEGQVVIRETTSV